MKYHFSSQSGCRIRRFFKRSPMDTGYDDRLPAESDQMCPANKTAFSAGIYDIVAN
jgi:hypothetical protein